MAGIALLGCGDAATAEFCPPCYCAAKSMGIGCYCYPDGAATDPNRGESCDSSGQISVPVVEFDVVLDKAAK